MWPSNIIRSIAEAREVTRPWRTLNISQSSSKWSSRGISGGEEHADVTPDVGGGISPGSIQRSKPCRTNANAR